MTPETPAYGRRESRGQRLWVEPGHDGTYAGQSYYDHPAIRASRYRALVSGYLFVGGLAGASQIIATIADLFGRRGDRGMVRGGRYLALLGSILSPVLLILDLQTPGRFYNMLRIFRPTSPMSLGSWTLAGFGTLSGVAAAGQLLEDVAGLRLGRWLGRLAGVPAAAAGMVMSCYTGSLLSATSVPFWASVYRLLPSLFGSSAMSTAAAATSLAMEKAGSPEEAHAGMERIALAASATELALTVACDRRWSASQVGAPINENRKLATMYRFGVLGLGILVPLTIHGIHVATGRRRPWASRLADASALAGGYAQRLLLVNAGNDSATRPRDYLRFTQPGRDGKAAA